MKRYGESGKSETPFDIRQTTDGGYIIVGSTVNYYGYAVKTDSLGDTLWTKTYDFIYIARAVEQTPDGGYLIAGTKLIKTDTNGDTLLTRNLGGTINWMEKTSDGGYILAGVAMADVLLIKIDSAYNEMWRKTFGGALDEIANSVEQTVDGGYIIGGWKRNTSVYVDMDGWVHDWIDGWLIKTDSAGNEIWNVIYDTPDSASTIEAVRQTNDGGYILAVDGFGIWGDPYPIYLIKTDENGDTLWTKRYADGEAESVAQTADGGYIIGGTSPAYGAQGFDLLLLKTNANGDILWTGTYGSPNNENGYAAIPTNDGGYAITGYWWDGSSDILLVKTDSLGNAPPLTGVSELLPNQNQYIRIFPNPNTGQFTLEIDLKKNTRLSIKLYQINGQLIFKEDISNAIDNYSQQIDLNKYAKGIYYVQVVTDSDVLVRKVIYQ